MVTWFLAYPFDIIKTKVQTAPEKLSMLKASSLIYSKNGIKSFFQGVSPCVIRAFPVNSVCFFTYELCAQTLSSKG